MRVVCVCPEGRDYSRMVSDWLEDFLRQTGREVELLDPETQEGEQFARVYDIVEYPTIVALGEDGSVLAMWRGQMLPRFDEVSYWA